MRKKLILVPLVYIIGSVCTGLLVGIATPQVHAMPVVPILQQVNIDGSEDANTRRSYWDNGFKVYKDKVYVTTNNYAAGEEAWQKPDEIYETYLPLEFNNHPIIETGKIVFVSNRDGNDEIYSMNYDGRGIKRLTNNNSEDLNPDWSSDGSKITFVSDRSGESEIYVMKADGSDQTQITSMTHSYTPQWSPDGTRIVFYTRQSNNNIIYTMDPDGNNLFQVTDPSMSGYDPYWSADGQRIVFYSTRTIPGIYVIDSDGTDQSLLLASSDIVCFAWSPDGTQMALAKTVTPGYNFDLFMYEINTGITTRLTNTQLNHNFVDWSPEGYHLIFSSNRDNISNFEIYFMDANGNHIINLSNNPAADAEPDWTK